MDIYAYIPYFDPAFNARLAQSAERKALNLVVVGSSPTVGELTFRYCHFFIFPIAFLIDFLGIASTLASFCTGWPPARRFGLEADQPQLVKASWLEAGRVQPWVLQAPCGETGSETQFAH